MGLPLQMHGTIETLNGPARALLCRDADRPAEAMIHWWGDDILPGGVLVDFTEFDNDHYALTPRLSYRSNESGGLVAHHLPQDDWKRVSGYKCELYLDNHKLYGQWTKNGERQGQVQFEAPESQRRVAARELADWAAYKEWADQTRADGKFVDFRGHGSSKFPLATTLARAGRTRLERFCAETLPEFWGHTEAVLATRFSQADPNDMSTILGLAQHHGLPTPLIDWSKSPYVAAFFAFSDALENESVRDGHTHVRIFGLTQAASSGAIPEVCIAFHAPYATYLTVAPRLNPRLYAQQGRFLVTNVLDLEHFLCELGASHETSLVTAVDVPIRYARQALEDLKYMGLSAATMYPGLDGVCKMMRHTISCANVLPAGYKLR